ncbi:MAG: biotin--[acetyl-CoA-carboxylase] ligase [Pseudomonadota bacterium]|nr:biotin--[acetyl-CoA-carboxylase] ligase [Pseudomonadota bacterium]
MSMLDVDVIRAPIAGQPRKRLDALEVFQEIESTNSYLLAEPPPRAGRFRVALAEHQTAGRGRMDKRWYSPASTGLCLSIAYTFTHSRADMAALTLATGVSVANMVEALGIRDVGLKWPNDLILDDGKFGGILTEVRSHPGFGMTTVLGIGLNLDLGKAEFPASLKQGVGRAGDLASSGVELPTRSILSARLIGSVFDSLREFEAGGFLPFAGDYERYDWLRGKGLTVDCGDERIMGFADGVAADGALRVRTPAGEARVRSGTVRLAGDGT